MSDQVEKVLVHYENKIKSKDEQIKESIEMIANQVKTIEKQNKQIKILEEALEECCVDDCGINLRAETKESLVKILEGIDLRSREALAKLKEMRDGEK